MRVVLELAWIVRADDVDLASVIATQLAQPLLIAEACRPVLLHQPLIEPQPRRAARVLGIELVVIEVRVTGEEEPAIVPAHRDPGVTVRVAGERHQQDLRRYALELAHGVEPEPALSAGEPVRGPAFVRAPLLRAEPLAIEPAALLDRILDLAAHQMNARFWKIVEPARVIEIEVREHDVPDVACSIAESLDLADRRQLFSEVGIEQTQKEPTQPLRGSRDIEQAETGIEQHQLGPELDEHASAGELAAQSTRAAVHQPTAERARRDAIEMMDAHDQGDEQAPCERARRSSHDQAGGTSGAHSTAMRESLRSSRLASLLLFAIVSVGCSDDAASDTDIAIDEGLARGEEYAVRAELDLAESDLDVMDFALFLAETQETIALHATDAQAILRRME